MNAIWTPRYARLLQADIGQQKYKMNDALYTQTNKQ
jgi:hypothetical protein